jgi:hypothetical protein
VLNELIGDGSPVTTPARICAVNGSTTPTRRQRLATIAVAICLNKIRVISV